MCMLFVLGCPIGPLQHFLSVGDTVAIRPNLANNCEMPHKIFEINL